VSAGVFGGGNQFEVFNPVVPRVPVKVVNVLGPEQRASKVFGHYQSVAHYRLAVAFGEAIGPAGIATLRGVYGNRYKIVMRDVCAGYAPVMPLRAK
jgi:hypothetical protein